ncbi:MAG: HD domain-containing protein [Thaumarchaeota archaeon]|nr:HD domain-containing protein [Nitrososphaerota archaeon]
MTQTVESAEAFAKERYLGIARKDGILHLDHLKGVVTRLKSLGISDPEVLAAAWLYEMIDDSRATFDEIDKRFGSKISVLVLALSRDSNLPKDQIDRQHVRQLKESPLEAKMIKLCDISTCFKDLKNTTWSKTRRTRQVKKEMHCLGILRPELSKAKTRYPGIENIINGINDTVLSHGQRVMTL